MKAGRKRNVNVVREANGRAKRTYENPRRQVAEQPHRRAVPAKVREEQEAGTEFGRLFLLDKVTRAQYEAGKRYSDLSATYLASIHAPSPNPAALNLDRVGLAHYSGMPDQIARIIKRKYDEAYEALGNKAGHRAQRAVAHHAVNDRKVESPDVLTLLITGLNALVDHFGIDSRIQITHRH